MPPARTTTIFVLIIFLTLLTACGAPAPAPALPTQTPSLTVPSPTQTPLPPTPTVDKPVPKDSPTLRPSPTPTPTVTPQPAALLPASAVQVLSSVAGNNLTGASWTASDSLIVVNTSQGVDLYDAADFHLVKHIATDLPVLEASLSPSGQRLAVLGASNLILIQVLDVADGKSIYQEDVLNMDGFKLLDDTHLLRWGSFCAGPGGASECTSGVVVVDLSTSELISLGSNPKNNARGDPEMVYTVAASADGARLATSGTRQMIRLWDAATGKEMLRIEDVGAITVLAFSADGLRLAAGSGDGVLSVFNAADGSLLLRSPALGGEFSELAYVQNDSQIAARIGQRKGLLFNAATAKTIASFAIPTGEILALRGDGRQFISFDGSSLFVQRTGDRSIVHTISGFYDMSSSLLIAPSGRWLATYERFSLERIQLWELLAGRLSPGPVLMINAQDAELAFSPDDQGILAGDIYTGLSIWNLATGEQRPVASGSFFDRPVYSPDGRYLAAYNNWIDALVIYSMPAGEQVAPPLPMFDYIRSLVFSPDSTQLVVVMGNLIQVYGLPQGNLLHQLEALEGDLFETLVYASDGRVLVFGNRSREDFSGSFLGVLDLQTSDVQLLTLAEWPSRRDSGEFSRDGQLLLNAGRDGIEIYATANGALVWRGQADSLDWRSRCVFSADSRGLLAYNAQGGGRLEWWDLAGVHDAAVSQPRAAGWLETPAAITLNGLANLPVIALPTPGPNPISPQNAGTLSETLRIGGGAPRLAVWAPDGRSIALATARGIALADPDTLAETALFALDAPALSAAFSPTGRWLAGGAENGAVVVWEKSSGRIVRQFSAASTPVRLAFSPDGSWLAFPDGPYAISIYEISNGRLVQRLEWVSHNPYHVSDLSFDQSGKKLLTKDAYGGISEWDIASGVVSGSFNAPAFEPTELWAFSQSADRRYLVAGTQQGVFFLWDTTSKKMILTKSVDDDFYPTGYRRGVSAVAVSTLTQLVAAAGDRFTIYLSTFPAGEPAATLAGHQARLVQLAFSPDGLKLLSLDETGVLKIWDARTGQILQTAGQFPGELAHLSIGADGALSAAFGDTYQRYSLLDGGLLAQDGGFDGAVLGLSPDGTLAAVFNALANWRGELRLWNLSERRQLITLEGSPRGGPGGSRGYFEQAAFSQDGSTLLATGFTASFLWHIPDGKPLQDFQDAYYPETACTLDGQVCAISDYGNNLSFWNGMTGQEIGEVGIISDSEPIALHPAAKSLAIRYLNHIRLVDLASGALQDSPAIAGLDATALAFSPDGSLLAAGSRSGRGLYLRLEQYGPGGRTARSCPGNPVYSFYPGWKPPDHRWG